MKRKVITAILIVIAVLLCVVGSYVAYVFLSYDRIEDKQTLKPHGTAA